MKRIVLSLLVVLSVELLPAKELARGEGSLTPMEARLEQSSGRQVAAPGRIANAQQTAAKVRAAVPNATAAGEVKTYSKVTRKSGCCKSCQGRTVVKKCCGKLKKSNSAK